MKKVVWKFKLETGVVQKIELPSDHEVLTVQTQDDEPCIWVLVDPNKPKKLEVFEVYGTGHLIHYDMGINLEYVGTWQEQRGALVWHLFKHTAL